VLDAPLVAPRADVKAEHVRGYEERVRTLQPIAHGVADEALPRAVMFRDSFANALVPYLSEDFSRILFVWNRDVDPDAVARHAPDIVIHQIYAGVSDDAWGPPQHPLWREPMRPSPPRAGRLSP